MADLAPVCFCVSTKFKAWEPWLSLPRESFVNFAFWPRYYSLVGPELCEFAIALLNFSPKTVTNDRWQNVQRVLNETKTCHICRIDLFQACVKKTVSNPFTKMLAHWSGGGFLQLCFVTQWKHCTIGEPEAWPEAPTNRSPCLLVAPSCNPSQAPLCVFLCLYCACLCVFVLLWHIWKQDELTIWKVDFYRCSWSFKCKF